MRRMKVSRLHRVLRLVTVLQSSSAMGADALADELGVSRRTLFRDLNMLEAAGIPYLHDGDKGYRIAPSFFLPPVNLKVTEAMGLMTLAKTACAQREQPLLGPAVDAVRKLMSMMPPPIRDVCGEMMSRVSVKTGGVSRVNGDADHYAEFQRAIDGRRIVQMRYHSLHDGGEIDLHVRPYHLHFSVRAWYVIGYSEKHRDIRVFKLARVKQMKVIARRYKLIKPFDVEAFFGKAWSMIRDPKVYKVELEFTPKVGQNVAEIRWHPTQQHTLHEDGSCTISFEVEGIEEISWWLLGYGDHVVVKNPAELRNKMRHIYASALARYDGPRGTRRSAS
jgi:predicted DNA-binding transcriptional regulator YafY